MFTRFNIQIVIA